MEPAFVLARRPYANSSLLLELFSLSHGRLGVIAKGERSRAGKQGGQLQPFIPLEVNWCGRGEIKTLTRTEARGVSLLADGQALYFGFYLNELLMRLLPRDDPNNEIFHLYAKTLVALAQTSNAKAEVVLRRFEVNLLALLGYAMSLDHCQDGEPVQPNLFYHFQIERGIRPLSGSPPGSIAGNTLLALQGQMLFDETSLRQARGFMRSILQYYLGDKPLKSRELFRALQTRGEKGP